MDKHRRVAINEVAVGSYFPTWSRHSDVKIEVANSGFEIGFPLDSPEVPMHVFRPSIRFGDAEEGLFVDVDRMEAIYTFVTTEVLPKFAHLL